MSKQLVLVWALLVLCVLGDDEVGKREQSKGIFIPFTKFTSKTIATNTKDLYDSFREQDFSRSFAYFDQHSSLVHHSLMPASGVYQGQAGVMEYFDRWFRISHLTDFNYRILYVDEARGESIVESSWTGILLRNNASFSGVKTINFIKWSLGKIRKFNVVDMQPEKMLRLFETKAEAAKCKVIESFFKCGACEETLRMFSDDATLSLVNLYPARLVSELGLISGSQPQTTVTLKGKNQLGQFINVLYKLIPARTMNVKILYGDNSTVVTAFILKPNPEMRISDFGSIRNVAKMTTVLYSISKINDQGLLSSTELFVNRPFCPWELNRIPQLRAISQNPVNATTTKA